jgi:Sec-independent protein secretion pathway component TatC
MTSCHGAAYLYLLCSYPYHYFIPQLDKRGFKTITLFQKVPDTFYYSAMNEGVCFTLPLCLAGLIAIGSVKITGM